MIYAFLPLGLMIVCVVHAIKTGRIFPWIYVIVFLPMIGSLIYLAMEIVPGLLGSRSAKRLQTAAARRIDPNKGYRQALRDAEMIGSVDSKRLLAEQLVQRGKFPDAVELYRSALQGHFRDDPVLWQGLARAQFLSGDGAAAQASLDELQRIDPAFVSADAHLLYARALELQGKDSEALVEYERLVRYFPGEEARCRYAQLLEKSGQHEQARRVYGEIVSLLDGAPKHYTAAQKEWGSIARLALKA